MSPIAFAPQVPFVLNATVRDNILFGRPFDALRYDRVVDACALRVDLAQLPAGDATEVGERGVTLSGGQKARLGLARAVYCAVHEGGGGGDGDGDGDGGGGGGAGGGAAELVLLDCVFSAVDADTGSLIFDALFAPGGGLLRGKTVVLAENQLQYVGAADYVLVLQKGRLLERGALADLSGSVRQRVTRACVGGAGKLEKQWPVSRGDNDGSVGAGRGSGGEILGRPLDNINVKKGGKGKGEGAEGEGVEPNPLPTPVAPRESKTPDRATSAQLITAEERQTGTVRLRVWIAYALACGRGACLTVLALLVVNQVFKVGCDWWLAQWSSRDTSFVPAWIDTADERALTLWYLCIFAALSVATLLLVAARALAIANATIGGARQLHEDLSAAILRAPVSFFDTTPVGRIVTRFAYDTECVDSTLPQQLQQFLEVFFVILGIFAS